MDNVSHTERLRASTEHETFVRGFLEAYKKNELLWDKNHPKNRNQDARNNALENLLSVCKDYFPEADVDFVRNKIDTMKCAFRREYKKVQESKKKATKEEDIYIPALWYYNLLLFTVGESHESSEMLQENNKISSFWNREYTVLLIQLLKKNPILYSPSSPENTKSKRIQAFNQITKDMISETGKSFEVEEIRKKITALKDQFRREHRNRQQKGSNRSNTLWCYDLLSFLKNCSTKKGENIPEAEEESNYTENANQEDMEFEEKDEKIFIIETYDDIFDTIGKNIALKLRDMSDEQRKYAEALIHEIMYHGLMENLNAESRLSLDGL